MIDNAEKMKDALAKASPMFTGELTPQMPGLADRLSLIKNILINFKPEDRIKYVIYRV